MLGLIFPSLPILSSPADPGTVTLLGPVGGGFTPIRCYLPNTGPDPTEITPPLKKSWSLFIKYQFRSFMSGDSPRETGILSLCLTI